MNLPNLITIFRIILVPIFLILFHSDLENRVLYSGLVFLLAGASDVLDGYIARKYDLTSKLGAVLDPLADKMMSFAVLISFTISGFIPLWVLYILMLKEIVMIFGGLFLYLRKEKSVIPSNRNGKNATVSFYIAIVSIILRAPKVLSSTLLTITVVLNILAFIGYLRIYINLDEGSA
mgnify:CR=1 FL=1